MNNKTLFFFELMELQLECAKMQEVEARQKYYEAKVSEWKARGLIPADWEEKLKLKVKL